MDSTKILYIDSNNNYSDKFLSFIINEEYDIKYCSTIEKAYIEYSYKKPDLIIIDIDIEDSDPFLFIKKIKSLNSKIKVIILTNNPTQEHLLEVIPLNIDKLILKNRSLEYIKNEIEKLQIKKESNNIENKFLFDIGNNHFYESETFRIIYDKNIIQLTSQEDTLIKELIKAQGQYITYEQLRYSISKSNPATIDTLRTVIRKIRKKTYDDIIENKSGVGYKINFCTSIDISTNTDINKEMLLDKNILILKGNKKGNDSLKYELEKFGFNCENVYTIKEAKEVLKFEKFDYIILALDLPDGNGIDFIREIEENNSSKVIILADNMDMHYKEYLYFKGILDYIIDTEDFKYLSFTIYQTILKIENNTKYNNILLIERSKRICEQIKDLLIPRNYIINLVNDIKHAYELIKLNKYNLVIIDINYKECFELIYDIKTNINKHLPFVVLTDANRTYDIVRDSYKNGANECLRKPIYAEEFILKVDQLIEHSKLIEEIVEQKTLLESYQQIVDSSSIISKTDKNGIITYVNDMFCNISGYSKKELIGKPHNIIKHPESKKELFDEMWETIKDKKTIWNGIIKNKTKKGNYYIVKTSIMPILDEDKNILEFIALRNDITKLYEENLNE